ncbi:uncharacterized protein RCC_07020 [Ramularia collo-cygni]|uniref:Transcription factor domain-containing protein n=1 Tax=Ramularia collo-cygni TaxID=112498 RepID=A0A2D3VGX6_9PEZI|nr:uncharacterized protein RCC_07020 [Ramularia collo-cygni]CZT21159.1 uncharacterized protein RCC_07020 [Ramularia collo-cygni]
MELGPEQWDPSPTADTSFTFLTVEPQNGNERPRLSAGVRKQMKSHLTLLQHKRGRQQRAAKISGWLKSSLGRQNEGSDEGKREGSGPSSLCISRAGQGRGLAECKDKPGYAAASSKRQRTNSSGAALQPPTGVLEQSFSRGSMAFRTFCLDDPSNIIGSSLSRLQLDVSSVLHFYHVIVDFQSKDFAEQFKVEHAAAFSSFLDVVLRDSIPLTIAILVAVRHLVLMKGSAPSSRDLYLEKVMRGYLVNCVNAALNDPHRSTSDPMLAAVGMFAIYEVKYGNLEAYHVHMSGLQQMVRLRGGIAEVSRQSPFVGGFIFWLDKNSSALANCVAYFGESQKSCFKADPNMFTLLEIHSKHDGHPT